MKKKKILLISIISSLVVLIGLVLSTVFVFVPSSKYSKAMNYYNNGEYDIAEEIFADLEDYKDSSQQLKIIEAHKSFNEGDIEEGIEAMCSIDGIVNVTYDLDNETEIFTEILNSTDYALYNEQTKIGYNFLNYELLSYTIDNSIDNYSATLSLKAIWVADTNTKYTVNYYLENYEDTNYTLDKTNILYGETNTIVSPEVFEYEGYVEPEIETIEILPDGSAQINYYYKREVITLSFVTNGGTSVDNFDTKWGTPISDLPSTLRENYTFGGWYNDIELSEQYEVFKSSGTLYAYWLEEYKPSDFTYKLVDDEYVLLGTSLDVLEKQIPTYIGGSKLVKIESNALANIEAISLIIPETVVYIEEYAFANASINEVIMSTNVTYISANAFKDLNGLVSVKYNGTIADWCNINFENEFSNPMAIATEFYLLGENGYELISDLVISDIDTLNNYQFYGFDCVTSVVVDNNVSYIGTNVFTKSNNISSLTIPYVGSSESDEKTAYLGYLFGGTSWTLNNVIVPSSLTSVTITNTLKIDSYAFYNCEMIKEVNLPNTLLVIGDYAFVNTAISNIVIPSSVTSIGYGAFKYCNLESITLPFIGDTAENNSSTNSHFGWIFGADSAYDNNNYVPSTLKTITITNELELDSYAFYGLSNVETITLPDTLLRINNNAFEGCDGLRYIFIPASVGVIEENIFEGLDDLVIYVEANSPMDGWNVNWNITNKPVYYGVNENTFYTENNMQYVINGEEAILTNCLSEATEIVIPETINHNGNTYAVTTIGEEAFYGCTNLEKVTMTSIETIGKSAFKGCANLVEVNFSDKLVTIDAYAFYGTDIEIFNLPSSVKTVGEYTLTTNNNVIIYCEGERSISTKNDNYKAYYNVTSETYLEKDGIQYVIVDGNAVIANYVGEDENVSIPSTITINENTYNVTTIGSYAFDNSSIITVDLAESITTIESYAFNNCASMASITLSTNITNFGNRAFNNCPYLAISVDYNQREAREVWGNNWYYGIYSVNYNKNNY